MANRPLAELASPLAVLCGVGALPLSRRRPEPLLAVEKAPGIDRGTAVRAAQRMNRAAGTLAASVLADSAVEHYRGQFHNKAMYAPLVTSALSLAVSVHGMADRRPVAHQVRDGVYAVAGLTGLVGTAFHLHNISRKPGGVCWQNLFYSAPIGAPFALILSGGLGYLAERVRDNCPGEEPTVGGFSAGRIVAGAVAAGLLGTVGEAGLLHFRGAFQNPAMYLPVTLPPVAAGVLADAALGGTRKRRIWAGLWLRLTALLGFAGSAFHIYGVSRAMNGWRNWRQNLVDGPPIPAPPAFTGLALAGLAALGLLEDTPDD
jgi:hypothetical protein